jgi:hypothetical protein
MRRVLPNKRKLVRVKSKIGGLRVYVDMGFYPDGALGELSVVVAKAGSVLRGMLDAWSLVATLALQHGCPVSDLVEVMRKHEFEPNGLVEADEVAYCTSVVDWVAQVVSANCVDP